MATLGLIARYLSQNYHRCRPEWMEPVLLLIGVPALLFTAGFGLAAIIKGGKEL